MARSALLRDWLDGQGAIAHTSRLRGAGFTDHDMREAIARDLVRRTRRSWLMTPSAPPSVVAAIAAGGRLTCLSEASRLGLWTPPHDDLHVAVAPTSSSPARTGVRLHWAIGPTPVGRRDWHEPIVNVLAHVAVCVPRAESLAVWEAALNRSLVTPSHLARVAWTGPSSRELAALASALSDSGLETIAVAGLRPYGLRLTQQVRIEGHLVDLLVGEYLVIQIDGFVHHSQAKDRRRDIAHDARLALLGYTVLRFDYAQIMFGWPEVERTILAAVAQGLHRSA